MDKILKVCLVFFFIWKITISQQVLESKDPRMKKYLENHIDEIKEQSSLTNQNGKNKKYIDLGPVNFMNKNVNPEKRTQSKIFRIKPKVPNQRKPFKFVVKNQDDFKLTNDGLKQAYGTNKEPKEEKVTIDSKDSFIVFPDESTSVKGTDPQIVKKLISKPNQRIPDNNTSPSKPAFFIDLPTSNNLFTTKSKITKPLVAEQTIQKIEKPNPDIKQDDIQIVTANVTDAVYNETEDTNSGQAKLYPIDNDKSDNEKSEKHPFLDAIQNDRYLMCSPRDAPNASVIADTTSIEDIQFLDDIWSESQKTTSHQAVDMIIPHIGAEDEVEDVTIKKCAFEEISEISNIPHVSPDPEFNTNNIPVPYIYNQVLKSIVLNNQLDPRTPDEQRIEKKDEKNVYIYNNFYQRPQEYWYGYNYQIPYKPNYLDGYCSYYQPTTAYNAKYGNNAPRAIPGIQNNRNKVYDANRDVHRNINAYCGYKSAQPQQLQNYWFRDYDTTRSINERIHRKWMNTEYNIKGKNAFNQFSDDNHRNRNVQSGPNQNAGGFI